MNGLNVNCGSFKTKVIVSKSAFNRYLLLRQYNCQQELNSLSPGQNEDPVNLKSNLISPERAFFSSFFPFPLSLCLRKEDFHHSELLGASCKWGFLRLPSHRHLLAGGEAVTCGRFVVGALCCTSALRKASVTLGSSGCKSALNGEGNRGSEGRSILSQLSWLCVKREARTQLSPDPTEPSPMAKGVCCWTHLGDVLLGRSWFVGQHPRAGRDLAGS